MGRHLWAGVCICALAAACDDSRDAAGYGGEGWEGEGGDNGEGGGNGEAGENGEGGDSGEGGAAGSSTVGNGNFVNGDFEQGPDVGWDQEPYPLIFPASEYGVSAWSGQYIAVLGPAPDDRNSATISQRVALRDCYPELQFAVWLQSDEPCDPPWWDDMGLYVNGEAVIRNDRLCTTDSTGGWQEGTADLSAWSGQTVTISFRLSTVYGDSLASTVGLDAMRIICR